MGAEPLSLAADLAAPCCGSVALPTVPDAQPPPSFCFPAVTASASHLSSLGNLYRRRKSSVSSGIPSVLTRRFPSRRLCRRPRPSLAPGVSGAGRLEAGASH